MLRFEPRDDQRPGAGSICGRRGAGHRQSRWARFDPVDALVPASQRGGCSRLSSWSPLIPSADLARPLMGVDLW